MKLSEPVTTITDYVLAMELILLCLFLFQRSNSQLSIQLWAVSFAAIAISAFAGGLFHGCRETWNPGMLSALRRLIPSAVAFALGSMLLAGIFSSSKPPLSWILAALTVAIFFWWIARFVIADDKSLQTRNFLRPILGLLGIFAVLLAYEIISKGPQAGRWILAGSIVVMLAGVIQQKGIQLHKYFNHNDLCHVLLMAAFYFLYRGGLLLKDH